MDGGIMIGTGIRIGGHASIDESEGVAFFF